MPPTSLVRARAIVAAFASIALVAVAPTTASAQFSNLFFFGDSFSDNGNATGLSLLAGLPSPTPPPYAPGRFSNDSVWTQLFAKKLGAPAAAGPAWLGLGNNYAVGAATTGFLGGFGSPTGMKSQAAQFAQDYTPNPTPNNALYVLWGGGNDIIQAVQGGLSPSAQLGVAQDAAQNIVTIAQGLYQFYGARNFLIPYLPNAGVGPLFASKPADALAATSLTTTFNALLAAGVQSLGATPGVNAYGLSLNNLLTNVQIDAAQGGQRYGIVNTTVPCFLLPPGQPLDCSNSLFADDRHPTETMHRLIADAAYDRVVNGRDVSVVPEPATVLLVGTGLLFAGVVARRRRSA